MFFISDAILSQASLMTERKDLETPESSTGYEMTEEDVLNQPMLKKQCSSYKSGFETEIEELDSLSAVFSEVVENTDWVGKSASKFWEVCADYQTVIMCLQMAQLFDIDDSTKLVDSLGTEVLRGKDILEGIRTSREGYYDECDSRDTCNYLAGQADDHDEREHWRSEASGHQTAANNYYEAWQRYIELKEKFETIRAFSITFFTSGTQYRTYALKGMQILATAFDGAGAYVEPEQIGEWRKGVVDYNESKLLTYAEKWKNKDGTWNVEAMGEALGRDDVKLSALECMAMGMVIDRQDFSDSDLSTLLSYGYVGEYKPYDSADDSEGTWTYRPSNSLLYLTKVYGVKLDQDLFFAEHRSDCKRQYQVYNVLYACSNVLGESKPYHGYKGDEEPFSIGAYEGTYDVNRVNISLVRDDEHNCYTLGYTVYQPTDQGPLSVDSHECTIMDYGTQSNRFSTYFKVMVGANEEDNVSIVMADGVASNLIGGVPVIGNIYSWGSVAYSGYDEYVNEQENIERNKILVKYNSLQRVFDHTNTSGTMIIDENEEVYITRFYAGKDELTGYYNGYAASADFPTNVEAGYFEYNHETFMDEYFNVWNDNQRVQFDGFVDYVESIESGEDK